MLSVAVFLYCGYFFKCPLQYHWRAFLCLRWNKVFEGNVSTVVVDVVEPRVFFTVCSFFLQPIKFEIATLLPLLTVCIAFCRAAGRDFDVHEGREHAQRRLPHSGR